MAEPVRPLPSALRRSLTECTRRVAARREHVCRGRYHGRLFSARKVYKRDRARRSCSEQPCAGIHLPARRKLLRYGMARSCMGMLHARASAHYVSSADGVALCDQSALYSVYSFSGLIRAWQRRLSRICNHHRARQRHIRHHAVLSEPACGQHLVC